MDLQPLLSSLRSRRSLLVAFSGGLDSTVLLHQLVTLRDSAARELHLRAVHIHHGISVYADEWAAHCEQICQRWGVAFEAVKVKLTDDGQGIEAQARAARYQALSAALLPGEVLLTAQHLDDQCETFLLALKRGSGPAGLAAMPEELDFSNTKLLRPLLKKTREELEQWAAAHRLSWIEDDSNQDDRYDRNFLRLRVLPELQQRWPHFSRSVARSAELCGEQEALLDELLAEEFHSLLKDDGALLIAPLARMSDIRRAALLRRWFTHHQAAMPSRSALQRVWTEIAVSREDANPRLKLGDFEVRRFQNALHWVSATGGQGDRVLSWPAPYPPLQLPDGLGVLTLADRGNAVRAPRQDEPVSIRFKASGLLHIVGRERGRSLKKIWQELQIPSWRRNTTPLVFYGEQLITAPGIFVTREGQATEESCWHIDWQKENE
jgi:tRNA(Ile)-lysidine synthase